MTEFFNYFTMQSEKESVPISKLYTHKHFTGVISNKKFKLEYQTFVYIQVKSNTELGKEFVESGETRDHAIYHMFIRHLLYDL